MIEKNEEIVATENERNKIVSEKLLLLLWKKIANVKFSHFIGLFHFYERQNETNRRHKLP